MRTAKTITGRVAGAALTVAVLAWGAATSGGAEPVARGTADCVRARALRRMAASRRPDAEDFLVFAAADASALVRQTAVQSIADYVRRPGPKARAALRRALADPHPLVVLAAAEALHVHPDREAAETLSRIARSPPVVLPRHGLPEAVCGRRYAGRQDIALEAYRAVAKIGWGDSMPILLDLLSAKAPEIRIAAARGLGASAKTLGRGQRRAAIEALAGALGGFSRRARRAAAEALALLGDPRGTGVLFDWLRRPDVRDGPRHRAVGALEQLTGRNWQAADTRLWEAGGDPHRADLARRIEQIEACLASKGLAVEPPDVFPRELAAADVALLDGLYRRGLFDPRGADRVRVTMRRRTASTGEVDTVVAAWRVPSGGGRPARLFGTWGRPVPRVVRVAPADFAREAERAAELADARADAQAGARCLLLAAWACRLDRLPLAARLLFCARGRAWDDAEMLADLARSQARALFLDAVGAYLRRADGEALAAAERLAAVCGPHADLYGPGRALLGELKRRKAAGSFGRPARPLPDDLPSRPVQKRIEHLIASLDEVTVLQKRFPGGVDLAADPRVMMLIDAGEAAVPALIDCIANDTRLTRCVHLQREFMPQRWVLAVREAALVAVQSILRRSFFEPSHAGDNLTRYGPRAAAAVAAQVRAYWKDSAATPLARRQMNVLTDPDSPGRELRLAAKNLAALGGRAIFGTTVGTSRLIRTGGGPSPAAAMFDGPTAGEAILSAMDRDLGALDRHPGEAAPADGARRDRVEIAYIRALTVLGDRRLADELARRGRAARSPEVRRHWTAACEHLGRPDAARPLRSPGRPGPSSAPASRPGP